VVIRKKNKRKLTREMLTQIDMAIAGLLVKEYKTQQIN
jgi:hypothetical protein